MASDSEDGVDDDDDDDGGYGDGDGDDDGDGDGMMIMRRRIFNGDGHGYELCRRPPRPSRRRSCAFFFSCFSC